MVEYATNEYLFLGVSSYGKGVGRIYSQSRGRGQEIFSGGFAPRPPESFSLVLAPPIENMLRGP